MRKHSRFPKNGSFFKHILTKVITFSEKTPKIKQFVLDTFLEFGEVSSQLTFKFSAWKRGCTVSFKLQMPQTPSIPFWKSLTKFYSVDTGRKLNVYKTFRRRPGRLVQDVIYALQRLV